MCNNSEVHWFCALNCSAAKQLFLSSCCWSCCFSPMQFWGSHLQAWNHVSLEYASVRTLDSGWNWGCSLNYLTWSLETCLQDFLLLGFFFVVVFGGVVVFWVSSFSSKMVICVHGKINFCQSICYGWIVLGLGKYFKVHFSSRGFNSALIEVGGCGICRTQGTPWGRGCQTKSWCPSV